MPAMFWPADGTADGERCGGCDGHKDRHEVFGGQLWCPAITRRETYNLGFSDGWDAGWQAALAAKAAVLATTLDRAGKATTRPEGPQKGPTVAEMGGG